MFKKIILIIFLTLTAGIALFFSFPESKSSNKKEVSIVDPVVLKVSKMSLDKKIGQLLIVGFENKYIDDHIKKMIMQHHVGGINLLSRNVENQNQIKELVSGLQKMSEVPLFIATDQEGGNVSRFRFLGELTPQSEIKNVAQASAVALKRAQELKKIGINMNFSPALDYVSDNNSYLYNRTFHTDPNNIGELGVAMISGYIKGGIIPVAKHFPGYGNVLSDPHNNKAFLNIDKELLNLNLLPFRRVLSSNSTLAVMTAHVIIPFLDSKPATLSSKFINRILREDIGFSGVTITDDLEMVSSLVDVSIEQAAVDAINAGNDIIISTFTPWKQIKIFEKLKNAVLNGEIEEVRVNESVVRILKLKSFANLLEIPY